MARAPETGFYFEPLTERLALVVEGAPFPSDDHWAFLGDPIEMTPELARLNCAVRWPGVDPDSLELELDFDVDRAVAELRKQEEEQAAGVERTPEEYSFDMEQFLAQMQELRAAAEAMKATAPGPADLEAALEGAGRDADEGPQGAGTASKPDEE
jgi:hypothetical protein